MDKLLQELNQPFRYTSERSRQGLTMAVAQADEALYLVVSGEAPADSHLPAIPAQVIAPPSELIA